MPVNFPANPTVGQQLVVGATVREWVVLPGCLSELEQHQYT
jgi:hypothetical protein